MNTSDLLIIYLACGAPCGVYFFLQNRKRLRGRNLWLKSFLTVFVWIPYAFKLLHDFATKSFRSKQINRRTGSEQRLSEIQRRLLELRSKSPVGTSHFEYREVFDRYAGLTTAVNFTDRTPAPSEREIFRVSLRQSPEIGAACLRRRNLRKLSFHQTQARADFLRIIKDLKFFATDPEKTKWLAFEFVDALGDEEARSFLAGIFDEIAQSDRDSAVRDSEKEVWNSKEHKPFPVRQQISAAPPRLRTLTTAVTEKD